MSARLAYAIAEAAAVVGLSPDVIRRAIKSRDLPVHYAGSKPLVLAEDLAAWVAALPTEKRSA